MLTKTNFSPSKFVDTFYSDGEPSPLGGSTGPRWKAACFNFWHTIFFKQNKTSFIEDQYCHLADYDSPLVLNTTLCGALGRLFPARCRFRRCLQSAPSYQTNLERSKSPVCPLRLLHLSSGGRRSFIFRGNFYFLNFKILYSGKSLVLWKF